jgi:hypothetical protein
MGISTAIITSLRTTWQQLWLNKIIRLSNIGTVLCIFSTLLIISIFYTKLPPEIPLWYSLPWGVERLVTPLWLFLLPIASLISFFINTMVALVLTKDTHLVFTQILFLSVFSLSGLSLVSASVIIWITL